MTHTLYYKSSDVRETERNGSIHRKFHLCNLNMCIFVCGASWLVMRRENQTLTLILGCMNIQKHE